MSQRKLTIDMKRAALLGGIGGLVLLLACGRASGEPAPAAAPPPPPSAVSECNLPPVPEHLARWAELRSTWEPLIVVSELVVPRHPRPWPMYPPAGRLSEEDVKAIARALRCLDVGWNVAALLGDHTVLERAGIATPYYVGDAVRQGIEEMKAKGSAQVYVSHYRPSLVFLEELPPDHWHPDGRGRLAATVSLCRRYTVHRVDWATGEEVRVRDYEEEKWAAGVVRWDDGSWRIVAFNPDAGSCVYGLDKGEKVPME